MEDYVRSVTSLGEFNPQNLSQEALEKVAGTLKQELLKVEAAKLLLPVKESPFSRTVLSRLSSFLKLVYNNPVKQSDSRARSLKELDSAALIVYGLCLTQKMLDNMRKDLFDVFAAQAIVVSQQNLSDIVKSDEINKTVLSSVTDQGFLQSKASMLRYVEILTQSIDYLTLRSLFSSPIPPGLQYSLDGIPVWCYSVAPWTRRTQTLFPRLLARAINGWVAAFLSSEGFTDGLIRVTALFDQSLLLTLFGWTGPVCAGMKLNGLEVSTSLTIARTFLSGMWCKEPDRVSIWRRRFPSCYYQSPLEPGYWGDWDKVSEGGRVSTAPDDYQFDGWLDSVL
jgi:hypothetical protein